jgi:hypothetical protein
MSAVALRGRRLEAKRRAISGGGPRSELRGGFVELLQKLVCGELDCLVSPLGGAVVAGDQPRAMNAPEVPEHESVARLGVLVCASVSPRNQRPYAPQSCSSR